MTTWHTEEPLSETLEFFWQCADPAGGQHDSGLRVIMTVASPETGEDIRAVVPQPPEGSR